MEGLPPFKSIIMDVMVQCNTSSAANVKQCQALPSNYRTWTLSPIRGGFLFQQKPFRNPHRPSEHPELSLVALGALGVEKPTSAIFSWKEFNRIFWKDCSST